MLGNHISDEDHETRKKCNLLALNKIQFTETRRKKAKQRIRRSRVVEQEKVSFCYVN